VVLIEKMLNFAQIGKTKNFVKENGKNESKEFEIQASDQTPKGSGANALKIELIGKLREKSFDPTSAFENGYGKRTRYTWIFSVGSRRSEDVKPGFHEKLLGEILANVTLVSDQRPERQTLG